MMNGSVPPLFAAACRLTGAQSSFVSGLGAMEARLRQFTFPNLRSLSPVTRSPVRQRSTGWMVGSVGMGIGEASAVRLQTSGANGGVIFYAPLTGYLRVRQDDTTLDTREPNAWMLLTDQPADAQTGDNLGVVVSLNKQRLQATANIMLGLEAQAPTAVGNHSQALLLDTPQGVYAERNLPVLLHVGAGLNLSSSSRSERACSS